MAYSVRKVVDSRVQAPTGKPVYLAHDGPASVMYQNINPPDPSSLQPTFAFSAPSRSTGLGRTVAYRMAGQLTINGTNLNNVSGANRVSFRAFPIQSCANSMILTIDQSQMSIPNQAQIQSALARIKNSSKQPAGFQSTGPTARDALCEYSQMVGAGCSPFNPPADIATNDYGAQSRTMGITAITVNPTNIVVDFDISETLILPPLEFTDGDERALYGLTEVQLSVSLSNIHRMLSIAIPVGSSVSSVTLAPTVQQLQVSWVTPHDRSMVSGPAPQLYAFTAVNSYTSTLTAAAVPSGSTVGGSSNTFTLPVVPSKIAIFATYGQTDIQDATQSLADMFLPCQSLSLEAGTRSNLLSNASAQQLYRISHRNGLVASWSEFAGLEQSGTAFATPYGRGSGAPVILDVAADLELPEGVSPGMNVQYSITVTNSTWLNQTSADVTAPRLFVVAFTDGILQLNDGSASISLGGVPGKDSDEFKNAPVIDMEIAAEEGGFTGGSWRRFHKFMRGVKSVGKSLKHAWDDIHGGQALAGAPMAGALLAGRGGASGGALLAGARMSRSRLYGK